MSERVYAGIFCTAVLLTGLAFSPAAALSTRDQIFSDVRITRENQHEIIKVGFHFPVRYLRHYPINSGRELRIQLEPILTSAEDREALNKRESLVPKPGSRSGLLRIEFEGGDFIDSSILLVFNKPNAYEVRQGRDFRSILILVPVEDAGKDPSSEKQMPSPSEKEDTEDKRQIVDQLTPEGERVPPQQETAPEPPEKISQQEQERLLADGEKALAEKNHMRAVRIYERLLDATDPEIKELAQFQLALAQENQGHLAHAKAEYENYLESYPDGPRTDEVWDRLDALMGGRSISEDGKGAPLWESEFFGSLWVYYDRDESFFEDAVTDEEEETVNVSSLTTGLDATWRLYHDNFTTEALAIGSFEEDFLEDGDSDMRWSSLYLDFEDTTGRFHTRWGRQSSSRGGVLGRFDGGRFGYRFHENVRLNLVAGYPVDRSSDGLETNRFFYGINFDIVDLLDNWDFNVYLIEQMSDGIEDRRAIGGEVRYVGPKGSFFSLIDYDLLYDEVSLFLFSGNYLLPNDKTRIHYSADFRTSPILSTSNALIGQVSPSLEALENAIGNSELREYAKNRTLDSRFVTLGFSHPITENVQIAGDVSWSKLDGAPAYGDLEAIESSGDEFYYSLQLIGNSLLKEDDLSSLALRYANTDLRDTYTLIMNSRYPINDMWRINPRMQVDYRINNRLTGSQWRFRPGLRLECMLPKSWLFEVDAEYSYATEELPGSAEGSEGYSLSLGFRWEF